MGGIALIWIIDCFVGFYLTLPRRKASPKSPRSVSVERQLARGFWSRWKPAWALKTTGSAYRITFDIHRAAGLWVWAFLLILAVTSASLNFYRELTQPIARFFSSVTPSPLDLRERRPRGKPIEPVLAFSDILERAITEAAHRHWSEPPGAITYAPLYGIYRVAYFQRGDDHGASGVGPAAVYFDSADGRYLGDRIPWQGTAGDLFLQIQSPLHSGRIAGLPGRIMILFMGLIVAVLSVTGVVIWYRKRRARLARRLAAASTAD